MVIELDLGEIVALIQKVQSPFNIDTDPEIQASLLSAQKKLTEAGEREVVRVIQPISESIKRMGSVLGDVLKENISSLTA